MWSCSLVPGQPVILHFKVRLDVESDGEEPPKLDRVKIWNYNKSLRDLNIGVKNARVLVGKDVIWEGIVEKGCGNQVFDYSSSLETPRVGVSHDSSKPHLTDRSSDADPQEPPNVAEGDQTLGHDAMGGLGSDSDGQTIPQFSGESQVGGLDPLRKHPVSWSTDDGLTFQTTPGVQGERQVDRSHDESTADSTTQLVMSDMVRSKTKILKRSVLQSNDSIEEIMDTPEGRQEDVVSRGCAISPTKSGEPSTRLDHLSAEGNELGSYDYAENLSSGKFGFSTHRKRTGESVGAGNHLSKRELEGVESPEISSDPPACKSDVVSGSLLSSDLGRLEEGLTAVIDQPKYERSKTRLLKRSTDDLPLPTVDDSIQIFASPRVSADTTKGEVLRPESQEQFEILNLCLRSYHQPQFPPGMGLMRVIFSAAGAGSNVRLHQAPWDCLIQSDVFWFRKPPRAHLGTVIVDRHWRDSPSLVDQRPDDYKAAVAAEMRESVTRPRNDGLPNSDDTTKLPSSEAEDFNQEEMSLLQQLQKLSGAKKDTPKPSWLINDKVEEPEEDEPLFGMETFPPKTSTGSIREGTPVANDLEDVRWRQDVQGSLQGHLDAPHSSAEPSRRAQWRSQRQLSLEESWTSLSMFDKSQKGRLTANMNTDVAGDSLDDYLNQRHLFQVQENTKDDDSSDEFEIPVLPHGQRLKILIKTTWGDRHYVGLNGVEVFLSNGGLAPIAEITADPPDINILEEYGADPRVVTNLVDGINRTRDDIHMWLAPYVHGRNCLHITFAHPVKIAMVRIWNYNKSRIHSFRGAKDIEIFMGERCIFKGEIDRASGAREGDMEAFGDTILFTEDEDILELISKHDEAYISQAEDWFSSSMEEDLIPERPKTADEGEERPFTTARKFRKKKSDERELSKSGSDSALIEGDVSPILEERYIPSAMEGLVSGSSSSTVFFGRRLKLLFTATWGDCYYLGLTGLEVVDPDGGPIACSLDQMDAEPRDLNILPEYGSDDRTLDKVIDGENITTSDEHMWMIPFSEGEDHTLTIDFRDKLQISGLRIWNYNKSPEDTYRGAKTMHVYLDNRQLSPKDGFLIRKGPGNCFFDFAQEITFGGTRRTDPAVNQALPKTIQESLRSSIVASEEPSQEYIPMHMPCGFVFQLQLLCTWGDQYYVGLNGIEFYDETGGRIVLTETNVAAYPPSINVLEGVDDDTRTPDKLIDDINDSKDGRHTWLAPILPGVINRVYVVFDEPVAVSMIKLWNYSKTPCRGVKEFGLYLDDLLIYNGILGQVSPGARGILPTIELPAGYHTILFTDDVELLRQEKHTIIQNHPQDQDVQMTNDREVVERHSTQKAASTVDQALRPKTSIVHGMRAGAIRR